MKWEHYQSVLSPLNKHADSLSSQNLCSSQRTSSSCDKLQSLSKTVYARTMQGTQSTPHGKKADSYGEYGMSFGCTKRATHKRAKRTTAPMTRTRKMSFNSNSGQFISDANDRNDRDDRNGGSMNNNSINCNNCNQFATKTTMNTCTNNNVVASDENEEKQAEWDQEEQYYLFKNTKANCYTCDEMDVMMSEEERDLIVMANSGMFDGINGLFSSFYTDLKRVISRWLLYFTGIVFPSLLFYCFQFSKVMKLCINRDLLHSYSNDVSEHPLPVRSYVYSSILPNRALSRLLRPLCERELPRIMRRPLYKLYGMFFDIKWDEFKQDLTQYKSMTEFFTRKLEKRRKLDDSLLISPVDGTIISFGEIDMKKQNKDENKCFDDEYEPTLEQIKGVPYNLKQFLGNRLPDMKDIDNNSLYYCIIYLHPGDYHRFHSCCNWECHDIHHVAGDLYPVKPAWLRKVPGLFSLNERVVLSGKWKNWNSREEESLFFSYTAVGAFNVGSICLNFDNEIETNVPHHDNSVFDKSQSRLDLSSLSLQNINDKTSSNGYNSEKMIDTTSQLDSKFEENNSDIVNDIGSDIVSDIVSDSESSETCDKSEEKEQKMDVLSEDECDAVVNETNGIPAHAPLRDYRRNRLNKLNTLDRLDRLDGLDGENDYYLKYDPSVELEKGSEMGYFTFGSTIVMIFESKHFEFCVKQGQTIDFGNAIGDRKH